MNFMWWVTTILGIIGAGSAAMAPSVGGDAGNALHVTSMISNLILGATHSGQITLPGGAGVKSLLITLFAAGMCVLSACALVNSKPTTTQQEAFVGAAGGGAALACGVIKQQAPSIVDDLKVSLDQTSVALDGKNAADFETALRDKAPDYAWAVIDAARGAVALVPPAEREKTYFAALDAALKGCRRAL